MAGVPSRCMKVHSKAFANELADRAPSAREEASGNRFPLDEDRVLARRHLVETLGSKGVKGAQVYPHEFVAKVSGGKQLSVTDRLTVNSQWASMRESIAKMVSDRVALRTEAGGAAPAALGRLVPLCDVSGSMSGQPMDVAIGLGILCSELTHPAFRDLVLCFSQDAQWHNLGSCTNIVEKVSTLRAAPWGMNTDFYKAMGRILKVVEDNSLRQEDVPNLLVISDMQFDSASTVRGAEGWNTAYRNIEIMFRDAGLRMHGAPLSPPTIVFWNVRGSIGFPAASDQKGVVMLSGFSPALLKFVLSGELEREEEEEVVEMVVTEDGDGVVAEPVMKKVKRQITPEEAMHAALHEEAYEPIRAVLRECQGLLAVGPRPLDRPYTRLDRDRDGVDGVAKGIGRVALRGRGRGGAPARGRGGRGRGRR
mmetsp:Transcript_61518/g.133323  ORF Transcript_61518/g.133323 Transcript_61518/m.133323 type:complete len:423 (-) Transcript_61518:56-1324(-)